MATEIYIISGFLGAGKTTFIQKLLEDTFQNEKIVLIENDFGEISVDAALMRSGGVEVRELNSGCICCSLSGDFDKALVETVRRFSPDKIIIEPSGVGKLSAIEEALETPELKKLIEIKAKITVADAKRCRMYLENFGEFFEDQIGHADAVVLSRTEDSEKTKKATALIHELSPEMPVFSVPWDKLDIHGVLFATQSALEAPHSHTGCSEHEHGDCCEHKHGAEKSFDTVTLRTDRKYTPDALKTSFSRLAKSLSGTVLRAKGIVQGESGYLELQYVLDELKIAPTRTEGGMICFIGKDINVDELNSLFDGK